MINLFKPCFVVLSASILFLHPAIGAPIARSMAHENQQAQNDALLLNELNALATKHLRAAGLADRRASAQVMRKAVKLVTSLSSFQQELRTLAKSKSIALVNTFPQGGQRVDGRVDSAPENLQDTSRNKNAGGEAGNTGQMKGDDLAGNDASSNALASGLSQLKGRAFDSAYMNLLRSDIPKANQLLSGAAASGDVQVSGFAKKYQALLAQAKI